MVKMFEVVQRLKEGLEHMDNYKPTPSDDEPLFVAPGEDVVLHEFAHSGGQLRLGDLRDLLKLVEGLK